MKLPVTIDMNDRLWLADFGNRIFFELTIAYLEARRGGKRKTFDEHKFEACDVENLINLWQTIMDGTYAPSRGTAHIVFRPVIREIFAAPFRDRVVHHFIYNAIYDWWDRHFIYDSYSCRENKGTEFGYKRLAYHMQVVSNNYREKAYVIKLDVSGYFMSISRQKLYQRVIWGLDQQFAGNYGAYYQILKSLIHKTIFDDPTKGVRRKGWPKDWTNLPKKKSLFHQPPGVGIVIGNLTSQLFSNIFLDQLDRFVTMELGYKHYGRYVDDFYFLVKEKDLKRAKADVKKIESFLKTLGLSLHPEKRYIQPIDHGCPFLGVTVYPGRIIPGRRVIKNAKTAFHEVAIGVGDVESVVSYLGHMKHMNSKKIAKKLFDENGWDYHC